MSNQHELPTNLFPRVTELTSFSVQAYMGMLSGLNAEQMDKMIGDKKRLANSFREAIFSFLGEETYSQKIIKQWGRVYKRLGIKISLSHLHIEERFGCWPIIVIPGLLYNFLVQGIKKWSPSCFWNDDLDREIDPSKEQGLRELWCVFSAEYSCRFFSRQMREDDRHECFLLGKMEATMSP